MFVCKSKECYLARSKEVLGEKTNARRNVEHTCHLYPTLQNNATDTHNTFHMLSTMFCASFACITQCFASTDVFCQVLRIFPCLLLPLKTRTHSESCFHVFGIESYTLLSATCLRTKSCSLPDWGAILQVEPLLHVPVIKFVRKHRLLSFHV